MLRVGRSLLEVDRVERVGSLTSFDTLFLFTGDIPDARAEASVGINFFAPNALTALYSR